MYNELMQLFEDCFNEWISNELTTNWNEILNNNDPNNNNNNIPKHVNQLHIESYSLYPTSEILEKHQILTHLDLNILKCRYLMLRMLIIKCNVFFH